MNSDRRASLIGSLGDKEYRDLFVDTHITEGLAAQIRLLREAVPWSQAELGERTGMGQVGISRLEHPDYGRYTLKTLKRLASAFDVALMVRFAPFSELVDWFSDIGPDRLSPARFVEDLGWNRPSLPQADSTESGICPMGVAEWRSPLGDAGAATFVSGKRAARSLMNTVNYAPEDRYARIA